MGGHTQRLLGAQILLGCFLVYVVYCCSLYLLQRHITFPGARIQAPPVEAVEGVERIWLETGFGKVEAWYLLADRLSDGRSTPAVIFAHGNAELIDDWPKAFRALTSRGCGVLLVEFPGFGRSGGSPSQKSITEAFLAGYDSLVARDDVDDSKIVFMGRSLGGGVACALAKGRSLAALILFSTFTSVKALAGNFFFPAFLVRDPFDNLSLVGSYSGPTLIVHGRQDEVIPYDHAVALHRAAKSGKLITYDCGHNDCPPNWEELWGEVVSFLEGSRILDAG